MLAPAPLRVLAARAWPLLLLAASCGRSAEISGEAAPETRAAALRQDATIRDRPVAASSSADAAARVVDLARLCAALDEDYVDGTLSDYYAGLELQTDWGAELRRQGSESVQPGRELQRALAELDPGGREPGLAACRKLVAYLDDVE